MTRLLTSSAGPWSPMPMHDVVPTLTNPSSETLPASTQRLRHMRSISAALPCMRSMMLSAKSTR